MIYQNPIKWIFLFSYKIVFRILRSIPFTRNLLRVDSYDAFMKVFTALFSATAFLTNTVGFFPTFRALLSIRTVLNRFTSPMNRSNRAPNINITELPNHFPRLDSFVLNTITNVLTPHWTDCVYYPNLFKRLFDIFLFLNFLGIFGFTFRIINTIFRFSIGTLLSSIGILWNESLLSISYLRDFALFIRDYVSLNFNFRIPLLSTIRKLNPNIDPQDLESYTTGLSFVGFLLLGVLGITVVLCGTHYYAPEIVNQIPYIGNVVELINTSIQSVYDYFFNNNNNIGPGNNPNNDNGYRVRIFPSGDAPEGISRSNSGGSTSSSGSSSSGSSTATITTEDHRTGYRTPISRSGTPLPITTPSDTKITPEDLPIDFNFS